jgi:hypothetical protein
MENQKPGPPPERLDIPGRSLFMSFGLLNEVLGVIRDITHVQIVGIDPELRNGVLRACLARRDANGRIEGDPDEEVARLSPADALQVLAWASGHALDFFLSAVEAAVKTLEPHESRLRGLVPTSAGPAA